MNLPNNREKKPQLFLFLHPMEPPVPGIGYISLSVWSKRPCRTVEQLRLLTIILFAFHKLMTKPYCCKQSLFSSLNKAKLS